MKIQSSKIGRCVVGLACSVLAGVAAGAQSDATLLDAREDRSYFAPLSGYFSSGGGSPTYKFSSGNKTFKFRWLQLDSSSGSLTGRPTRGNIKYLMETKTFAVTVTRTGSGGVQYSETKSFQLPLRSKNRPPVISDVTLSNQSVSARVRYSLDISTLFEDPDTLLEVSETDDAPGDVLTYGASVTWPWGSSLPTGLRVNGNMLEGIPTRLGDYWIRLRATDLGGLSAYRYYWLTVDQHPADTLVHAEPLAAGRLRVNLPYVEISRDFTALYQESRCRTAVFEADRKFDSKKRPVYPDWTLMSNSSLDPSLCLPTGQDPSVPIYSPPALVNIPYLKYVEVLNENDPLTRTATVLCLNVTFHSPDTSKIEKFEGWVLVGAPDADDASRCAVR